MRNFQISTCFCGQNLQKVSANFFRFWGTSSPDPYGAFAPGPQWGIFVAQTPRTQNSSCRQYYTETYRPRETRVEVCCNDVVTCEIKLLFQTHFSLRRRPTEVILFQRMETCLKLFQNYYQYCSSRIFSNMFNVAEITSK